jgi:hypothetical protein
MPWYNGLDWNRTEDLELPRWILPKDGNKPRKPRAILERVKFRGLFMIASIEYRGQCLEAEG